MPLGGLNRVIWAVMLIALAVLAHRTYDDFTLYFAGVGKLDVRVESAQNTVYLDWRGKIEAPMANRISEAFNQHRGQARRFVLSLSSPGGSLDHGAEVVRLLRRMGETHEVDTLVEARRACASMCVPIYLQGQKRTAAANARFMFHEVSFREFRSEEEINVPAASRGRETDRLFSRYFLAAGVPRSWISEVRIEMKGGNDVWRTARQLVDEKANIVQQIF